MDLETNIVRDARKLANQLSAVESHRFLIALAADWSIVVGCAALAEWSGSWLIYLAILPVIASRQHAFMILTHEGVHQRVTSNRMLNDLLSDLFAAYPVFFDTQVWRITHFAHHQHLNSDMDPDWTKKIVYREWQFPQSPKELGAYWLGYVFLHGPKEWLSAIHYFSGAAKVQLRNSEFKWRLVRKAFFWSAILSAFVSSGRTEILLWYWLVPFFFVFPSIQRMRSIAEHFGLENEHPLNQSRDVVASPLEAFFFGPHNVRYHLVHHLFSAVPFHRLPELHRHLMENPAFASNAHQNLSYVFPTGRSVLDDITSTSRQALAEKREVA